MAAGTYFSKRKKKSVLTLVNLTVMIVKLTKVKRDVYLTKKVIFFQKNQLGIGQSWRKLPEIGQKWLKMAKKGFL